jgi:O-antigen ligase
MKNKIILFCDTAVYWSLILIPFSVAIAPFFSSFFVSFLFANFFLKKVLKKEKFIVRTAIDLPFLVFVSISILSIFNSVDLRASIKGVFKLVEYGLTFLIFVEELRDIKQIKRIVLSIIFGACIASFDAIWQMGMGWDFIRGNHIDINGTIGLKRATAAFPNPNVLGVYLSSVVAFSFGMLRYDLGFLSKFGQNKQVKFNLLRLCMIFVLFSGLFFTFARPAALALMISILIYGIVKKDKVVLIFILAAIFIFPILAPKSIKKWAKEVKYQPAILMCNADRMNIYRNSINMIRHNPVIGVGLNTFSKNYHLYKLPEQAGAETSDTIYAHNNFFQMAGEIGLLGLFAFLWMLFCLFKEDFFVYRAMKNESLKLVLLCLIVSLFAFLINGMTETSLYYSRVSIIFWYLLGFSLALKKFINANEA